MTEDELAAIEDRCNAAPPPPWVVYGEQYLWSDDDRNGGRIAILDNVDFGEDARRDTGTFITAARDDIPALIAAVRAAQAQSERRRVLLTELLVDDIVCHYFEPHDSYECPSCDQEGEDHRGPETIKHTAGCLVTRARRELAVPDAGADAHESTTTAPVDSGCTGTP